MRTITPSLLALLITILISCGQSDKVLTFEEFASNKSASNSQLLNKNSIAVQAGIPTHPRASDYSKIPEEAITDDFQESIEDYFERRNKLNELMREYDEYLDSMSFITQRSDYQYIHTKLYKWNGNIFWAPASKSDGIINKFGDEVRAVFGAIPDFDVSNIGVVNRSDGSRIETVQLGLQVDGNQVELKRNIDKPGSPLEFEHRDVNGDFIKWTRTIEKCDKPSLAGGVTPCGTASRVSVITKGNVEWIALARKTRGADKLDPEEYWSNSNNDYLLLGYIGFNRISGEVAFFDGITTIGGSFEQYSYDKPVIPPGGRGYIDMIGRKTAIGMYDSTMRINCANCHDNQEPRIITPYIKQERVGFRDFDRADQFSVGDVLPDLASSNTDKPYRVVGTDYTKEHANTLITGRVVIDPNQNCTSCHPLTNLGTARFSHDAVGRLSESGNNTEDLFRTDWTLRSNEGKIHPWMLPEDGNDLSGDPLAREITQEEWQELKKFLDDQTGNLNTKKLYTSAPAPESAYNDETRLSDPSAVENYKLKVVNSRDVSSTFPLELQISWNYWNNLGNIPTRDDVRFHISVLEEEIVQNTPNVSDYPSIEVTKGTGATKIKGELYVEGDTLVLKEISFQGHFVYTEPDSTQSGRSYSISLPAKENKRYLVRVLAKRHTFDNQEYAWSEKDHVEFIETKINL